MSALERLTNAIQLAKLISDGAYVQAAKLAVAIGLDLVPADDLRAYLSDAAAERAKHVADIVEDAKVGP